MNGQLQSSKLFKIMAAKLSQGSLPSHFCCLTIEATPMHAMSPNQDQYSQSMGCLSNDTHDALNKPVWRELTGVAST